MIRADCYFSPALIKYEDQLAFLKAQAAQDAVLAQRAFLDEHCERIWKFLRVHQDPKKSDRSYHRDHQFYPHFRKKCPLEGRVNQSNADQKGNSNSNDSQGS